VWIGAAQGSGLTLFARSDRRAPGAQVQRLWLHLPPGGGALRARLYAAHVVRDERSLEDGALELLVDLPSPDLITWAAMPGVRLLEQSRCRARPLVPPSSPT